MTPEELLLERVAGLGLKTNTDKKRDFNVFDLCRVGTRETTHSAIIASLLDPKGLHGLKEKPLELFLRQCGMSISNSELQDVTVETECQINNGNRRLDILISGKSICVVIENKTESADSEGQLDDYCQWLNNELKNNKLLVYLTYFGSRANHASEGTEYKPLSYERDVFEWLNACANQIHDGDKVKSTIEQYALFVNQLVEEQKVKVDPKLYGAISNNFGSALQIVHNLDAVKAEWLYENIFKKLKEKGFLIEYDKDRIIKTNDVYITYQHGEIKIIYAFNNYGFKNARREIYGERAKPKISSGKNLPHYFDDGFFEGLTTENQHEIAEKTVNAIVADAQARIDETLNSCQQ